MPKNTLMAHNNPQQKIKIPELLAPAGSLDKLKSAIHYGADAVYLGGGDFSLRAHAVLTLDDLSQAVSYSHKHGKKVYITINIMAHNSDLNGLEKYLGFLADIKADGLIISDPGIIMIAQRVVPEIPIHLSTQANTTNLAAAQFWQGQGVKRINLARELGLAEITAIRAKVSTELELFVHGAICISYSGRCSLSLYMTGRNANNGNCAHPCRYKYALEEEKRPGNYFPVEEDDKGTYIFNSKDLCLLNRLPELILAGADSLKIEGRMKSVYYVGAIVRLYRGVLNHISATLDKKGPEGLINLKLPNNFQAELPKIGSRGYTENFIDGPPTGNNMLFGGIRVKQTHAPIGIVRKPGKTPLIEMRNTVFAGEKAELLGQNFQQWPFEIKEIITKNGASVEKANPGNMVYFKTTPELDIWQEKDLVRRKTVPLNEESTTDKPLPS